MKRLIIIVLVLLVVALGGAVGLVMLGVVRNPFQPKPTASADAPVAENTNGFKAPSSQLTMVKIPDVIIPVIMDGEVKRRVSISLRLVTSTVGKAHVTAELPKYQNAMLQDLLAYFQDYFTRNDAVDVEAIRQKSIDHAAKLFGDDVTDVLLINVYESGGGGGTGRGTFISDE